MTVLVASDLSENAENAFRTGVRFADQLETDLRLVHSVEAVADGSAWGEFIDVTEQELDDRYRTPARRRMREWLEQFDAESPGGADLELEVALTHAADGILEAADREEVDLIVLGATGRGRVTNLVLGSTAEEVVQRADAPVLIVPKEAPAEAFERIVAPVDFSYCSRRSLGEAVDWARREGAALEIVHAYSPPGAASTILKSQLMPGEVQSFEEQREARFESIVETLDLEGVDARTYFEEGSPHDVISDVIDETGADLVVMGSHGRRGLERMVLGSTAAKVLREMPAAVMVVRTAEEGAE